MINGCSGFTNSKAVEVSKEMSWEAWQKVRIFYLVNGWLVSHAGFHPSFWRPVISVEENLRYLWDECLEATSRFCLHQMFVIGAARGGFSEVGGPLWLDWNREFVDGLDFPQLVGHTTGSKVRRIGRSYCIDCNQSAYAMIGRDGSITFKTLRQYGGKVCGEETPTYWAEDETPIVDMTEWIKTRNQPVPHPDGRTIVDENTPV